MGHGIPNIFYLLIGTPMLFFFWTSHVGEKETKGMFGWGENKEDGNMTFSLVWFKRENKRDRKWGEKYSIWVHIFLSSQFGSKTMLKRCCDVIYIVKSLYKYFHFITFTYLSLSLSLSLLHYTYHLINLLILSSLSLS